MTQDMRQELGRISSSTQQQVNGSTRPPQKNGVPNGTNGYSPATNGENGTYTNGHAPSKAKTRSPDFFGHSREEVARLLIQTLEDLGYQGSAEHLSHESGFQVESPAVAAFRHAILEGEWLEAELILFGDTFQPDGGGVSIRKSDLYGRGGLELLEDAEPDHLKFLIREQKYVELLGSNRQAEAISVLQSELQPLKPHTERLNNLSGLLMAGSSQNSNWNTLLDDRQRLLSDLSKSISPSAMIPQHRFADLLNQVHQGQVAKCLYHNPSISRPPSLFMDHVCDQNEFPLRPSIELSQTDGEVWYVDFSHNGKFLAACGESNTVIIYDTETFDVRHRLSDHGNHVVYSTWSPDDSKIITCSRDAKARIWDTATGKCLQIIDHHEQAVSTAAWTPDGRSIVTGSLDRHSQLCMRSADGSEPFNWNTQLRTQDLAITPDGQKLVVMSTDNFITIYSIPDRTEIRSIKVAQRMTSVSVSRDSRTALVNMENDEIHLIDIESAEIIRRYTGQRQNGFIIRSTFGGTDEGLVVSGSYDSKVYIWHKLNGTLIETLEGHSYGCVNSISWSPSEPSMFASASDDRKVLIWTKPEPSSFLRKRVSSQLKHRHSL